MTQLKKTGHLPEISPEVATHFVCVTVDCGRNSRGKQMITSFCKEAQHFKDSGGLTADWGKYWIPVIAGDDVDARTQVCAAYGGVPSAIITGEW